MRLWSGTYAWVMCGRFTHMYTWKELHRLMSLIRWPLVELEARLNVSPGQVAPVVRVEQGERVGTMLKWGLVPLWADDPKIGNRLINARGESVALKPSFRTALARRRCLVPVSGFYEWRKTETGKQPYRIGRVDGRPFAFAGLWEWWSRNATTLETFTIVTTEPNALVAPIHDRMPVIIEERDWERWLDPGVTDAAEILPLIKPAAAEGFEAVPMRRDLTGRADEALF